MNNSLISQKLIFSKYNYLAGENIDGYLELEVIGQIVILDIYIDVFIEEKWSYQNDEEETKKKIRTSKVDSNSQFIKLNTGIFKFPFRFIMSEEMEPSFEYYINESNQAYIRYLVEAKIFTGPMVYYTNSYLLIKARPVIDINFLSKTDSVHIYKFGFSDQGITEINATLPQNNFLLKNNIPSSIIINNTKGKLNTDYFKISLLKKITLKSKYDREMYDINNEMTSQIIQAKVLNGSQKEFNVNLIFNTNNIPNKNPTISYNLINDANYLMPSVSGELISCEYSIEIVVYFEQSVLEKYRPKVTLPVYLVHQLPIDYQLEILEELNYEKAIEESKNVNKEKIKLPSEEMIKNQNNNNINNGGNNLFQSKAAPLANLEFGHKSNIIKNDDSNNNNNKINNNMNNIDKNPNNKGNNLSLLNQDKGNICDDNIKINDKNKHIYDINEL